MSEDISNIKPDLVTARHTIRFLSRELQAQRFILHAQKRDIIQQKRKVLKFEKMHSQTKNRIEQLKKRINGELELHPDAFKGEE